MKYIYYPGCTLETTALEYNKSTQAAMQALGAELVEIEDWNCCGAAAAEATSHLLSMVLASRNLALAEKMDGDADLLIPCSGCYLNLRKVEDHVKREEGLVEKINEALKEEELEYKGRLKVRHLLDVLSRDFEPEDIKPLVKKEMSGLKVAPYYGCQALRPYPDFDDPQAPKTMEPVIQALGADVHPWDVGSKCCGAALMNTKKDVALELTGGILKEAKGADCVVTVCPMCQLNLEAYQKPISQAQGEDVSISILYLPQLMGVAFGLSKKDLKLNLNLAMTKSLKEKLGI